MWRRCPHRLRSGVRQTGLRRPDAVDAFKALMLGGQWDFAGPGKSFVYFQRGRTVWITEGHHRANAALEIGKTSGDWSYLHRLLAHGKRETGSPPYRNRGLLPARGVVVRADMAWVVKDGRQRSRRIVSPPPGV
jgi:hypothetical protein